MQLFCKRITNVLFTKYNFGLSIDGNFLIELTKREKLVSIGFSSEKNSYFINSGRRECLNNEGCVSIINFNTGDNFKKYCANKTF